VLAGARETLERVDALIVEYWPGGLHRMGDRAAQLHQSLRTFSHGVVLDQQALPDELLPVDQLLASLAHVPDDGSDDGFYDLLLARRARLQGP
jgi:hypothetical protein